MEEARVAPMYTAWDEYFVHQTPDAIDVMAGPEKEWVDYGGFVGIPWGGEGPAFQAYINSHPNAGVMQGSAMVLKDNVQYNFRASRRLHHDRANLVVGPLSFTAVEPLYRWRIRLTENAYVPFTIDVELEARSAPRLSKKIQKPGEPAPGWGNMCQAIRWSGNVTLQGRVYDVTGYAGLRDRSWGLRTMDLSTTYHTWICAMFRDYYVLAEYHEEPDGTPTVMDGGIMWDNGERISITGFEHDVKFDRTTRDYTKAEYKITDASGRSRKVTAKPISHGMYFFGTWTGEGTWVDKGPLALEGDTWDLNDNNVLISLAKGMRQQPTEFSCNGDIGYGIIEYIVSKRHQKYGPQIR